MASSYCPSPSVSHSYLRLPVPPPVEQSCVCPLQLVVLGFAESLIFLSRQVSLQPAIVNFLGWFLVVFDPEHDALRSETMIFQSVPFLKFDMDVGEMFARMEVADTSKTLQNTSGELVSTFGKI